MHLPEVRNSGGCTIVATPAVSDLVSDTTCPTRYHITLTVRARPALVPTTRSCSHWKVRLASHRRGARPGEVPCRTVEAKRRTFDLIVASTLVRASESARIVGQTLDVPIEYDPDWMERDNGPLAGLPFDEGEERYPRPDFSTPSSPSSPLPEKARAAGTC